MNNTSIRKHIVQQRKNLSPCALKQAATLVFKQIKTLSLDLTNKNIASYLAVNGEMDSQIIIDYLHQHNKAVFLPVINGEQLHFAPYDKNTPLIKNKFAILEPKTQARSMAQMDIVFVPLVAFKKDANRLGMGGGYYDKTIAAIANDKRPLLIGLAHEFQHNEQFQVFDWDIQLDMIITEQNIYFKKSA